MLSCLELTFDEHAIWRDACGRAGMCQFEDGTSSRKAASLSSVEVDVSYKRLRHVVAKRRTKRVT